MHDLLPAYARALFYANQDADKELRRLLLEVRVPSLESRHGGGEVLMGAGGGVGGDYTATPGGLNTATP